MIGRSHWLTLTLAALLLASCGSSPAVRYFGLEAIGVAYQRDAADAPVLAVGPIRVPDYLKRPQMVTRGQGSEFLVDDFNRWAEPLDEAIHRTIASNIDGLLDSVIAVAFPSGAVLEIDYRLFGRIDRFDADSGGNVTLDVQWGIGDASGDVLTAARRGRYQSRANQANDPAAIAAAMSDTLEQFSRDIAAEYEALSR